MTIHYQLKLVLLASRHLFSTIEVNGTYALSSICYQQCCSSVTNGLELPIHRIDDIKQWSPIWSPLDVRGLQFPPAPASMANGQGMMGIVPPEHLANPRLGTTNVNWMPQAKAPLPGNSTCFGVF